MNKNKPGKNPNDFIKYSNIAFQMMVTILIGVLGGLKLDDWLNTKFPVFTLVLSLFFVFAAIYIAIKDFL